MRLRYLLDRGPLTQRNKRNGKHVPSSRGCRGSLAEPWLHETTAGEAMAVSIIIVRCSLTPYAPIFEDQYNIDSTILA